LRTFGDRRWVIAIENSDTQRQALGLVETLVHTQQEVALNHPESAWPIDLLRLGGSGETHEVLRTEDLADDPNENLDFALRSRLSQLDLRDGPISPLRSLQEIARTYKGKLAGVILLTGSPPDAEASADQTGVLYGLKQSEHAEVIVLGDAADCGQWTKLAARCQSLPGGGTAADLRTIIQDAMNRASGVGR
jgi:hypothetical protein